MSWMKVSDLPQERDVILSVSAEEAKELLAWLNLSENDQPAPHAFVQLKGGLRAVAEGRQYGGS